MRSVMIILTNKVVTFHKKKTSMRLTNLEWDIFNAVCEHEKIRRRTLLEHICETRSHNLNMTSAVRLFMLLYLYNKSITENSNKKRRDSLHRALQQLN